MSIQSSRTRKATCGLAHMEAGQTGTMGPPLPVTMILKKLRYSVHTVNSGEEVVECLKKHTTDLLVLDMIMEPGISGLETYKRVLHMYPTQKTILASGYIETEIVKEAQKMGAGTYVKKPYDLEKLGLAVKNGLGKIR